MTILIRGGRIFGPESRGERDIFIADRQIIAVSEPGSVRLEGLPVEVVDASGMMVCPGLIDPHVHILGGGGEGGPATRAPEIHLEDIIACGVTTVIGCLGTDGITRHMTSLLAKARALDVEGVTTYIFSGSYEVPPRTLTGSVRSDLVLIDKVIGAGEIAISDHRSSQPTFEEIARLAAECRVGGMLGGKAGILHLHLGDGARRLDMLHRLIRETEIPATQVIPTHVNRNRELLEDAVCWALEGGSFDLTVGAHPEGQGSEIGIANTVTFCLKRNVPIARITVSSDSNGSLPVFNRAGELVGLTIASQKDFFRNLQTLLRNKVVSTEDAIRLFSTNSASFYKLPGKGVIKPGSDADLIILDEHFELRDIFARGRRMMSEGHLLAHGTFSRTGQT
jgi:beta-aspartyl-dipeptidase (metallo-type)